MHRVRRRQGDRGAGAGQGRQRLRGGRGRVVGGASSARRGASRPPLRSPPKAAPRPQSRCGSGPDTESHSRAANSQAKPVRSRLTSRCRRPTSHTGSTTDPRGPFRDTVYTRIGASHKAEFQAGGRSSLDCPFHAWDWRPHVVVYLATRGRRAPRRTGCRQRFLIVSRSVTARPEAVSLVEAPRPHVRLERPQPQPTRTRALCQSNQLTADPPAGERRFNVELVDPGVVENQHAGQCTVGFGEPELGQKDDSSGDPA